MTPRTTDRLNAIEKTAALHIEPQRADGRRRTPTTIWW